MRRRVFLCLLLIGFATARVAGAASPILRAELETNVAVPGQVIILEVTILVPTWMPKPPAFPTFQLPDVSVRLPEGASRPTMERIGGESWPGVTRAYELSPIIAGKFRIPPQDIAVTYADPETLKPTVVNLRTKEIVFEGRVPVGAEDLDPFIAAQELTLEQVIDGEPENLEAGAAFARVVTARVTGASSIFLPPLIPTLEANGLVAYPKEPVFNETAEGGVVVGERIEEVTYVAEAGGRFRAAPIRLRWWNLRTKQIEVAEIEALEIASRGAPPMAPSTTEVWRVNNFTLFNIVWVVLLGVGVFRGELKSRLVDRQRARREKKLASESYAFAQVAKAMRKRRFGDAIRAVEIWSNRLPRLSEAGRGHLFEALEPLSAVIYRGDGRNPAKKLWSRAYTELCVARRKCLSSNSRRRDLRALPILNPNLVNEE